MRNITISLVALFGLLPAYAAGPSINPLSNIQWPKVTGTTAPSIPCNSTFYGMPYTNVSTGDFYVCAVSGWVLFPGAGGTIGGSATSGFLAIGTGAASIGPSLADYGISVAGTFTFPKPTIFNDGTGVAGTAALQQGTATSNSTTSVTLTVPTSVTSYRIVLPGVHSTGSNTFLSCTAADPSVCTWAAGGGGAGTVTTTGSPASGNLTKFSGATSIVNGDLSGDVTTSGTLAVTLNAQYKKGSCTEVWVGSGTSSVLTTGDDAFSNNTCYNDSGVTRTITAVKCRSDVGSSTTTVNPTFGSAGTGTTILSGALTCGSSLAYSSSGTVSNSSWTTGTGINPAMGGVLTGTSIAMIVEYTF